MLLTETPLGPDYVERGRVLAFDAGRLLRFDQWSPLWGLPDIAGNRAVLSLELEADGDATRVLFKHELPSVAAIAEHSDMFWRVGLTRLKELLDR